MKLHDFKQGSEEWFAVRLGKLTASHAQAISAQGKGLDTLCFKKAAEILTGKPEETYTNADMERGNELEHLARNSYELESGNLVQEIGFFEVSEFVGCSPDGFVGKDGLVEFKCPNDTNFTRYLYDGKIDPKYRWQMQMQMQITDRKWVDYVVFNENFPKPTVIVRVKRNKEDIVKVTQGIATGVDKLKGILEAIHD